MITVISGLPRVSLKEQYNESCKEFSSSIVNLWFPERSEEYYHPYNQYLLGYRVASESISQKSNLVIVTYSNHILNGIRVAIKELKSEGAVYQLDGKSDNKGYILSDGSLTVWVDHVFTVWDEAIDTLVF